MSGLLLSEAQKGFPGHLGGIRLLKFTSDRRRFFCADLDMRVSLRDESGELASYPLESGNVKTRALDWIRDIALSADESLAFVAAGVFLRCIDLGSGEELWRYRPTNLFGFLQASPRAIGVTKNGDVWVSSDNASMDLFSEYGDHVASWRSNDAPNMVSRMSDGERWVGSDGYGLSVWEPTSQQRLLRMKASDHVYAIKAFPNAEKVAVRSESGVSVVDLSSGETESAFPVLAGLPFIDVSEEGQRLLVGEGRGVCVYGVDGANHGHRQVEDDRILTALFDGDSIVTGTAEGDIVRIR